MRNYAENKERIRETAKEWQLDFGNHNYSYSELAEYNNYFNVMGKRYGLLKEFRENGII